MHNVTLSLILSLICIVLPLQQSRMLRAQAGAVTSQSAHTQVYAAQKKRNPYTRAWWKESVDYTGQLTARAMSMALQSQLVDASITRVRSLADWENWVDQDTLPKVRTMCFRNTNRSVLETPTVLAG